MARPRQPVELLLYKGKKNLTKAEIEERKATEVKAAADNIRAPDYLPDNLKGEFDYIASELMRIGIMSNLDVDALARFLLAQEQYVRVTERLRKVGVLNEDYAYLLNNQDKLFKQCRQSASDLGLTISSRCKLVIPKKEKKEKTPFDERFGNV